MKLSARDAPRYFRQPDPGRAGLLIFGVDAMRVAMRRQEVIAALIGPEGEAEMRLTRIPGAELRRDPALLSDAVKAQGFFPGPRVAFVEEATDGLADTIAATLADWQPGDAQIVVTAGALKASSALRKRFESHPNAYAAAIYDDPPSQPEVVDMLRRAGLSEPAPAALEALLALSRALDPGDFRQTVEKVALYKHGDAAPLTPDEIALCAPATLEADLDEMLHVVAEARVAEIGPVMARLQGRGVTPVALCIGAARHFRTLHAARADPANAARHWAMVRNFRARDRMQKQAQSWPLPRLEAALALLTETDLALRSSSRAPALAVIERALIRLAMLRPRR